MIVMALIAYPTSYKNGSGLEHIRPYILAYSARMCTKLLGGLSLPTHCKGVACALETVYIVG